MLQLPSLQLLPHLVNLLLHGRRVKVVNFPLKLSVVEVIPLNEVAQPTTASLEVRVSLLCCVLPSSVLGQQYTDAYLRLLCEEDS